MGQEFVKPGNAPPWLGELVFTAAAKVFSNSTQVCQHDPCCTGAKLQVLLLGGYELGVTLCCNGKGVPVPLHLAV